MAIFVLKNAYVKIGATNVSDHVREVAVNMTADDVDVTAMGAGGHSHLAGLRDDKITLSMYSDFNAITDAVLWPLFSTSGTATVEVAANSSTASATNPVYYGVCSLLTYTPIGGAAGAVSMTPVEFVVSGTVTQRTA